MILPIQFKIKNNPNYVRFLRSNSHWYKYLNRDYGSFKKFEEEVKREYKLTSIDKIEKAINTLEMFEKVFSAFK